MKAFVLCVISFCYFRAVAQPDEVKKVEALLLNAFVKKDSQSIARYVDDNFILLHADGGVQNKKEYVGAYTVYTPEMGLQLRTEHRQTIDKGGLVILRGILVSRWKEGNQVLQSKVPYTDTYQKSGGQWRLITSFVNDVGEDYYVLTDTTGIREAIKRQYKILDRTVNEKDLVRHLNLKTGDFSTLDHLGNPGSPQFMRNRSKNLFNALRDSIQSLNEIESIEVKGDTAKVIVHQSFKRNQLMAGQVRRVETSARQRESWMLTREGWKLVFVDQVQPLTRVVDGKPTNPAKPFNPNDPPYKKDLP
jgi:ketosteroid isomerase-like protein